MWELELTLEPEKIGYSAFLFFFASMIWTREELILENCCLSSWHSPFWNFEDSVLNSVIAVAATVALISRYYCILLQNLPDLLQPGRAVTGESRGCSEVLASR